MSSDDLSFVVRGTNIVIIIIPGHEGHGSAEGLVGGAGIKLELPTDV
jgi:hypothetical protein